MLHLDDQTMPVYQQKVSGEVKELEQRFQALKKEKKQQAPEAAGASPEEWDRLDARFAEIQKKIDQLGHAPGEMRDRLRAELDESLEELRSLVNQAGEGHGNEREH